MLGGEPSYLICGPGVHVLVRAVHGEVCSRADLVCNRANPPPFKRAGGMAGGVAGSVATPRYPLASTSSFDPASNGSEGAPSGLTKPKNHGFIFTSKLYTTPHEGISKNGFLALSILESTSGVISLSGLRVDRTNRNSKGIRVHRYSCPRLAFSPIRRTGRASGRPCRRRAC